MEPPAGWAGVLPGLGARAARRQYQRHHRAGNRHAGPRPGRPAPGGPRTGCNRLLARLLAAGDLAHGARASLHQVQARYPQAIIQPVASAHDPLALQEGETVSVVELCAGAAAYLPLRAFREREWQQEGADPLLGILGVFNHLPPQMRVVTQLALLPASPTWSSPYLRKAVEHPLEQEHLRARRDMSGRQASGPGTLQLVGMGVLVALLLVWWRFQKQINAHIPVWLVQAGLSLLHGKAPQLSPGQVSLLIIAGIVAFVALFCLAFLVMQIRSRLGGTPIYDRRLVEEKTARPAYRVRLRLFVFSTSPDPVAAVRSPFLAGALAAPFPVAARHRVMAAMRTKSWRAASTAAHTGASSARRGA